MNINYRFGLVFRVKDEQKIFYVATPADIDTVQNKLISYNKEGKGISYDKIRYECDPSTGFFSTEESFSFPCNYERPDEYLHLKDVLFTSFTLSPNGHLIEADKYIIGNTAYYREEISQNICIGKYDTNIKACFDINLLSGEHCSGDYIYNSIAPLSAKDINIEWKNLYPVLAEILPPQSFEYLIANKVNESFMSDRVRALSNSQKESVKSYINGFINALHYR